MESNIKVSPERVLEVLTAIEDGKVSRNEVMAEIVGLCDTGYSLMEIIDKLGIKEKRKCRLHDSKEKESAYEMSLKQEYLLGSRINTRKIAKKLNYDYHNGEEYWTSKSISEILSDKKKIKESRVIWTNKEKNMAYELSQQRQKYSNNDIAHELNMMYRNNEDVFTAIKIKAFISDRKKSFRNQPNRII